MNTSVKMKNKAEIFNLKKYSVANGNLITLNYPHISFLETSHLTEMEVGVNGFHVTAVDVFVD